MIIAEASPKALGIAVVLSVAPVTVMTMTGCDQACGDALAAAVDYCLLFFIINYTL